MKDIHETLTALKKEFPREAGLTDGEIKQALLLLIPTVGSPPLWRPTPCILRVPGEREHPLTVPG
jgi:hypothetical protein